MHAILNRHCRILLVSLSPLLLVSAIPARADIYQWEYINPADLSQGKQQSTTLAPDGAGVDAVPDADLSGRDLTMAYLSRDAGFPWVVDLSRANLSDTNLSIAHIIGAVLTDADLTNTNIRGANLSKGVIQCTVCPPGFNGRPFGTGISLPQLYSTASYQAHDLTSVSFDRNELAGGNFVGQILADSRFAEANLAAADFSQANLTNASLTAAKLNAARFNNSNLTSVNLRSAVLTGARLSGANLTGADISYARLDSTTANDFTASQLYTTASYQARSLDGINLANNDLSGWSFVGQSLLGVTFDGATLTDADLTGAYVHGRTGSDFRDYRPGANFAAATTRGFTAEQLYSTSSYQARALTSISLSGNDMRGWNFAGQGLGEASLYGANLSHANLADASFHGASLGNADLTGADVRGAGFTLKWHSHQQYLYGGIAQSQLYSTGSYQSRDMTGIKLSSMNLTDWNFRDQNLSQADFAGANLSTADFTNADVRSATFSRLDFRSGLRRDVGTGIALAQLYSTASYHVQDLSGIGLAYNDLTAANFVRQNLTSASFGAATLTGAELREANLTGASFVGARLTSADFTGADVRGAYFSPREWYPSVPGPGGTGFTLEQLYSTISYEDQDLRGISLTDHNFAGANLAGQNLTNSSFSSTMLTGANLTAADARGAVGLLLPDAITTNLVWPDGHVSGFDLDAGGRLVVRDYDGKFDVFGNPLPPIPITIDQHLSMGPGGTLRMVFEADAWDSTISFAPGIPVTLGGTLELTFADDVNPASQLGRTIDLFDWTGVTPTGAFAIASPYLWNLSNLYTTGEVTLTAVPEPASALMILMGVLAMCLRRCAARP